MRRRGSQKSEPPSRLKRDVPRWGRQMFFPGFRVTIVVRGRPNIYIGDRSEFEATERGQAATRKKPKAQKANSAIAIQPTLRQAWPRVRPRPQYAFKMSMFNVSCNSH